MPKKNISRTTNYHKPGSQPYLHDYSHPNKVIDTLDNRKLDPEPFNSDNTCARSAFQKVRVRVPVVVKPFSFAGPTTTKCCREPVIEEIWQKDDYNDEVCYFTITQEICVEVPVHFGAKATVGEPWVECLETSTDNCEDCD
jgi:hypothetical protein